MNRFKDFLRDESAPTAVEYAIMLALIALAVAIASPNIRQAVVTVFTDTSAQLTAITP